MEKILYAVLMIVVSAIIWNMRYQTKRDAKREEKMQNFVDTTLKDLGETVKEDSGNTKECTKAVKSLKNVIENHLVYSIKKLTEKIGRDR